MKATPDVFTLDDQDPGAESRFARWSGALGALFDVAATQQEIAGFSGGISARVTARVMLSALSCSPLRLSRSPSTTALGFADHYAICVVKSGSVSGRTSHDAFDCREGEVFFLDMMQSVDFSLADPAEILILWIPRARMLKSLDDESALHGLALNGDSAPARLIGASLGALALEAAATVTLDFDALAEGVIELTAKALGPVLQSSSRRNRSASTASLVAIRRFIDRHLASGDLGVDMLAARFGLSRATLYRLFEPLGGVADYIREQRLLLAYQEVVAAEFSNRRIGLIGFRLGFKNVSSFSRAFRQRFGVSPREARSAVLQRSPSGTGLAPPVRDGDTLAERLARVGADGIRPDVSQP